MLVQRGRHQGRRRRRLSESTRPCARRPRQCAAAAASATILGIRPAAQGEHTSSVASGPCDTSTCSTTLRPWKARARRGAQMGGADRTTDSRVNPRQAKAGAAGPTSLSVAVPTKFMRVLQAGRVPWCIARRALRSSRRVRTAQKAAVIRTMQARSCGHGEQSAPTIPPSRDLFTTLTTRQKPAICERPRPILRRSPAAIRLRRPPSGHHAALGSGPSKRGAAGATSTGSRRRSRAGARAGQRVTAVLPLPQQGRSMASAIAWDSRVSARHRDACLSPTKPTDARCRAHAPECADAAYSRRRAGP